MMTDYAPSMSSFTCISCRVAFKDAETQRLHYKTDWHRYNLKRKVAELPPVTAEEFQRRVLQQRSAEEDSLQDKSIYCKHCRKHFTNMKAYENHVNSKKHQENVKDFDGAAGDNCVTDNEKNKTNNGVDNNSEADTDDDSEAVEVDSDEWNDDIENPIDNNDCLFCNHHSASLLKNLKHMTVEHSFFVPDIEYCIDLRGLLSYLGEKITKGYMCLWCNDKGKTFYSADAARNHMLDKGHCMMLHEGIALAEYADYYDYSKSYPDDDKDVIDANEEVVVPELDDSEYQLVLPSGITVGHRSLMRYYKQSLNPNSAAIAARNNKKLHKVLAQYRSLGWTETQQEAAAKKARDIHYMKRIQAKYNMKMGMKNNKIKQHHFRQQINY